MNNGYKLQQENFLDISDYARPLAVWIALGLKKSRIRAYHLTIFHFLISIGAAWLVLQNNELFNIAAAAALLVKNIFDAADGSLARIQNRPSVVGRFLDSNADFIGNILLFGALPDVPPWLKLLGAISFLMQGSFYNYYSILYRHHFNGEKTSRTHEAPTSPYPYDNPLFLNILFGFYKIFYLWQDKFVDAVEVDLIQKKRKTPSKTFLTLMSFHGQGFQHLMVIALLFSGNVRQIPLYFLAMNLHLVFMLTGRSLYSHFQLHDAETLPKNNFSVQ